MQVLLTAATAFEIAPVLQWMESDFLRRDDGFFEQGALLVYPLVTWIGPAATAFHTGSFLTRHSPDLALSAGIAGAFDPSFRLGDVVNVGVERFGDLGVEEADGRFSDLFDLGLLTPHAAPFVNGLLRNPAAEQASFLPHAQGLTVHRVHGSARSIKAIRAKYPEAQVESMEGAAFFYACLSAGVNFLEIRSISNYVEPRNREAWNIPLAIDRLNQILVELLDSLK